MILLPPATAIGFYSFAMVSSLQKLSKGADRNFSKKSSICRQRLEAVRAPCCLKSAGGVFCGSFATIWCILFCMMTAVMIFHPFNALMNDRLLNQRVQQDIRIEGVLGFGSSVVAFVVLFFMLSANHFFLSQRQKEISVYQLLGLRQGRLAWLLLRETFLLNFFSLNRYFYGNYFFENSFQ